MGRSVVKVDSDGRVNKPRPRKGKRPAPLEQEQTFQKVLPPIQAKTKKQREYLKHLSDPEIQVVIALGFHGTGKTYCPSAVAADMFRDKVIESIVVSRAYVQTGKTSGFKPGTSMEKLYPYVRNVLDTIKQRIGDSAYAGAIKDGQHGAIQVQEVESIRGRSFDEKGFLIIDEAQQTTPDEMKSIVTRVSDNCKLVLCGDIRQCDIQGQSGLEWFMKFAERHNLKGVAIVNFDSPDDIVRGGLVKDIAIGLMKDERSK